MVAATTIFIGVCVLPVVSMLSAIIRSHVAGGPERPLLLDPRQLQLLGTTVKLGVGAAMLATVIGASLGFVLARIHMRFKTAVRIALVAPAVLPPYVVALAATYIAGSVAFTLAGATVVLAVVFYPLAMLATEAGLRSLDPRLEEAALLTATPGRVLRRITGPLVAPNLAAAALIVFVLAISEFSVPGLLQVRVFTTEVFTAFAALYDFGAATLLSLPLIVMSFVVVAGTTILLGDRLVTRRRTTRGSPHDAYDHWKSAAVVGVVAAIGVMLVMPVAALVREALRSPALTAVVWNSRTAVINSLMLSVISATAAIVVTTSLGHFRARTTPKAGMATDGMWLVLFAVPSTVVGIGLIGVWNRTGLMGDVYGTRAMLVIATLARLMPVAALTLAASMRSVPQSHEEAASVAGAGWLWTLNRIVLPQILIGALAAWVVVFILAFGEVGASILVAPPGETTLPIRIYTMTANAPPGHVAALALFQSLVILCPLSLLGFVVARRNAR